MAPATTPPPHITSDAQSHNSPERIAELSQLLSREMQGAIDRIQQLNLESWTLSLNAQIEAARSGVAGRTFSVVAESMRELSRAMTKIAESVSNETQRTIAELEVISRDLATSVRGTRLADLALTNIDLIDRNLYERSCDCRWWATDDSLVQALTLGTPDSRQHAGRRLGAILDSYTVYFDLVLADADGRIVANGRSREFASIGHQCGDAKWFRSALATRDGTEFGFESVHASPLVNNQRVLIYSAGVREHGDVRGNVLGVLGIVFKWDALAHTIVENTPLAAAERARTRVCILDERGLVLADTAGQQLRETIRLDELGIGPDATKQHTTSVSPAGKRCVAYAKSPGFETYATGWHSLVIQDVR